MSSFVLFAIIFICACSFCMRGVMLDLLPSHYRRQFRRDECIYVVVLALAIVVHQVAFGAHLVTTSVTQWGTDLYLSFTVLLVGSVRFMDIYRVMKSQFNETEFN